jgi:hypothetical protein
VGPQEEGHQKEGHQEGATGDVEALKACEVHHLLDGTVLEEVV